VTTFEFRRFRFHLEALGPVRFPRGKSGNIIRGAFGAALRRTAPAPVYARLFEPGSRLRPSPSGLSDWPRPFVFRTARLDGAEFRAGEAMCFDVNTFDLSDPVLPHLVRAVSDMATAGFGPERGPALLGAIEQLDVTGWMAPPEHVCVISLDPEPGEAATRVRLQFVTPTELKAGGAPVERPEFSILFARLRDRLSTLRALYGPGPLEVDFRGLGEKAKLVRLCRADLEWERVERRSARTGQVHPLGGFTGEAEYEGDLGEFLPWLRAARWVGVGRQTVWGKGEVRVRFKA
jgi:hypothetical protein